MGVLMKCGHVAHGRDINGNPVCPICVGSTPDAKIVENNLPSLDGRIAECRYCSNKEQSSFDLAFFEYRPSQKTDIYYCGCFGWD